MTHPLVEIMQRRRLLPERYPADFDAVVGMLDDARGDILRLRGALRSVVNHLGIGGAPDDCENRCDGCRAEMAEASRIAEEALAAQLGDLLPRKELTITRLVGLLGRLEWAGSDYVGDDGSGTPICPACKHWRPAGHREDCWLAAELAPQREQPPHPEGQGG